MQLHPIKVSNRKILDKNYFGCIKNLLRGSNKDKIGDIRGYFERVRKKNNLEKQ